MLLSQNYRVKPFVFFGIFVYVLSLRAAMQSKWWRYLAAGLPSVPAQGRGSSVDCVGLKEVDIVVPGAFAKPSRVGRFGNLSGKKRQILVNGKADMADQASCYVVYQYQKQ